MTVRVNVTVDDDDAEAVADILRHIGSQLEEGFTSGFDHDHGRGRYYFYEVNDIPGTEVHCDPVQ